MIVRLYFTQNVPNSAVDIRRGTLYGGAINSWMDSLVRPTAVNNFFMNKNINTNHSIPTDKYPIEWFEN